MSIHIKARLLVLIIAVCFVLTFISGCNKANEQLDLSQRVHTFYYPWYGNPEFDGEYIHWRHHLMTYDHVPQHTYPGGDDIGADFYPMDGPYSSHDPAAIRRQMKYLKQAGIGVISVSWLGKDCFEGKGLPLLMDIAAEHDILVNFHIEPVIQKSVQTIREAIVYLTETYGDHPAFYRDPSRNMRSMFYVYDSYLTPVADWAELLSKDGSLTIRGTEYDADVIGLMINASDKEFILDGHFDGFYSYFAVDGFSYSSTTLNWPALTKWAKSSDLLFIPSVGPGYSDLRIRPQNGASQRNRKSGEYYDCMFNKAILADPYIISITSFNEWHEGTQLEPAAPKKTNNFEYIDYQPLEPDFYLDLTSHWIEKWKNHLSGLNSLKYDDLCFCGDSENRRREDHLAIGCSVKTDFPYNSYFSAGGDSALTNGIFGQLSYKNGCWQGYQGVDFSAVVDLGKLQYLDEIGIGFLQDRMGWMFLPKRVSMEISEDGIKYTPIGELGHSITSYEEGPLRQEFTFPVDSGYFRYIKINAENFGPCPDDHPGAGNATWLFIDEVVVR